MGNCSNCSGSCEKCNTCGGCGQGLELTMEEVEFLRELGQYSFLPVARKASDMVPVYLEERACSQAEYSLILQCLEARNLVSIDYGQPLKGADMSAYGGFPVHGSVALTRRGQQVLELLEMQGYCE